ncbi:MAG: ATP-binding protein [Byssovorax sp.]
MSRPQLSPSPSSSTSSISDRERSLSPFAGMRTHLTADTNGERAAAFQALVERSPEMVLIVVEDEIAYANPAALRSLGYEHEREITGRSLYTLLAPSCHAIVGLRLATAQDKNLPSSSHEHEMLHRSGRSVTIDVSLTPITFGRAPAVALFGRDTTERRRRQAHHREAERLAALSTLAAGVAHEINNPLTYVLHNIEVVTKALRDSAEQRRRLGPSPAVDAPGRAPAQDDAELLERQAAALAVAYEGAHRVRRIVRDLTTFARAGKDHREPTDVRRILDPIINLSLSQLRRRARLVRDLRPVPLIDASEAQLGQVFVNILTNAIQAIPEGKPEDNEISISTSTDEAGHALIEIRDSGVGIEPKIVERIFEPFFTTKPPGVGTGLGLSICHGIVTSLGGAIAIASTPGQGSVFRITLPPSTSSAAPISPRH